MEELLVYLTAVAGLAKDLHYTLAGKSFYGNHLLMDRIYDDIYDFVDEIKENYFMYQGLDVPSSKNIFERTAAILENIETTGQKMSSLLEFMRDIIYLCDQYANEDRYDCGDNDLLGRIASKMKNNVGLLRRVVEAAGEG